MTKTAHLLLVRNKLMILDMQATHKSLLQLAAFRLTPGRIPPQTLSYYS